MAAVNPLPTLTGNEQVVHSACAAMRRILDRFRPNGALDWPGAEAIVKELYELLPPMPEPVPGLRATGGYDEAHAINVAVYAMTVARGMGLPASRMVEVGLAGLFHDLGKIMPQSHPKKAELSRFEEHGAIGRVMLLEHFEVLPRLTEWVGDHHERVDGSGPRGTTTPALEAQIIGLCDIYDANLTPHPRRATLTPHSAWNVAMAVAPRKFDPAVVAAFKAHLRPYPPGTRVVLTGGTPAVIVTPAASEHPLAPVVRCGDGKHYDLAAFAAPRVVGLARD